MSLALIAAQSENRVIGRGSEIPWRVKGEQALFKRITMNGVLVMGRKTFESIGRPLPGRVTVIVTRNPAFSADGCEVATSLEDALAIARGHERPVFIAGGGELYEQSILQADALHLTTIHTVADGDVLFPEVPDTYRLVSEELFESNINYTYRYYENEI